MFKSSSSPFWAVPWCSGAAPKRHVLPAKAARVVFCPEQRGHSLRYAPDPVTGEETVSQRELVRLAIPRRTYTQSHMDYVIEVVLKVWEERGSLSGYRIVEQAPFLRHFSAKLAPLG